MSKRLKELVEQCETKEIGYYFFDREKFAEVIIRECIDLVPWQYEEKIKQNFGIE